MVYNIKQKKYKIDKSHRYCTITIPAKFKKKNEMEVSGELYFYEDTEHRLYISSIPFEDKFIRNNYLEYKCKYKLYQKGKRGWAAAIPKNWYLYEDVSNIDELKYYYKEKYYKNKDIIIAEV